MRRTVPPSAEIQASIDKLLSKGMVDDPQKMLSELARLGARLIVQRAVEDEFETWLGRARYEHEPGAEPGSATGFVLATCRPGRVSCGSRSRRRGGGDAVRVEVVPEVALQAAAANGPALGRW